MNPHWRTEWEDLSSTLHASQTKPRHALPTPNTRQLAFNLWKESVDPPGPNVSVCGFRLFGFRSWFWQARGVLAEATETLTTSFTPGDTETNKRRNTIN